jgi:hypothetical protein
MVGLFVLGAFALSAPSAHATQLSNITVGRFQDFTVVTLFGDAPMSVTHQIVEAKDGKPHRIVVDLTGANHGLPQNNFSALPEGSIQGIRTSQFAVTPEPVVRVVLDLAHPAAYRLETPGNNVRVMVSLPGDPPIGRVWSARDLATYAAQDAEPVPSNTALPVKDAPQSEAPVRVKTAPQADVPPVVIATPELAAKPVRVKKAPAEEPVAKAEPVSPPLPQAKQPPPEFAAEDAAPAQSDLPQVPLPMPKSRPANAIDYNLPLPPAHVFTPAPTTTAPDEAEPPTPVESEPELAVTESLPLPEAEQAQPEPVAESGPATEPATLEEPSKPVASLTTLPPLAEVTPQLVPQRTKVLYHAQGRRDPFLPLLQVGGGYNAAALPDVSNLRLVGLLHDVREAWGLFEDANGYGYILRKGDRVKNGRLTKLTGNRAYFQLSEFGWSRSIQLDLEPEG